MASGIIGGADGPTAVMTVLHTSIGSGKAFALAVCALVGIGLVAAMLYWRRRDR